MLWQFVLTNGSKELMSSAERTHSRRETKRGRERKKKKKKRKRVKVRVRSFWSKFKRNI